MLKQKFGKIFLIPTPLTQKFENLECFVTSYNAKLIAPLRHFVCESQKCAERFLGMMASKALFPEGVFSLEECTFMELNEHTALDNLEPFLAPVFSGFDLGLMSDAGCPCVGDPGSVLVELAHKKGVAVEPLVGPSAILLAVMASGLGGQNFSFNGYLPIKSEARRKKIKALEKRAQSERQTQAFIEAPYRNIVLFGDLKNSLSPSTKLCVAAGLTTPSQFIATKTVSAWQSLPPPPIEKVPTMFVIGC